MQRHVVSTVVSRIAVKILVDYIYHFITSKVTLILVEFAVGVIDIVLVGFEVGDELFQRLNEPTALHVRPIDAIGVVLADILVAIGFVGVSEDVDKLLALNGTNLVEIKFFWLG